MTPKDALTTIRDAVRKDKINVALQLLQELVTNAEELNQVLNQSGRYAAIQKDIRLGMINWEDASVEKNKIRMAILDFLTELEVEEMENEAVQQATSRVASSVTFNQYAKHIYNIDRIEGGATFN